MNQHATTAECKICGSPRLATFAHTARCRDCGVLLYFPYPADIGAGQACWDQEKALYWYTRSAFLNHTNFTNMIRFALNQSLQGDALDLLDYGGGGGQFACVVRSHFPLARVFITDVSDQSLLPQYAPLNRQILFRDFAVDSTRFDCIFMNDVFEHVTDPAAVLKTLAGKLKPGGSIFVDTPRAFWIFPVTRLVARPLYRRVLRGTVSRAHLQVWSTTSFRMVVRQAGLKIARYRELSEFTMPARYYLTNMGIRNPLLRVLGALFYSTARYTARNKIMAILTA